MSAIDVLKRARMRIAAHGYDPGVTEPRKGRQVRKGFLGYSFSEAVYGLDRAPEPTEDEIAAVSYLEVALELLHPETKTVEAFNATAPSKAAVQNVIERAINLAKRAPQPATPSEPVENINTPPSAGFEGLFAEAKALGIETDPSWSLQQVLDAIAAAKEKAEPLPLPKLGPTPVAPPLAGISPYPPLQGSDGMEGIVETRAKPLGLVHAIHPEGREATHTRISALAGLDAEGGIAPNKSGGGIDREQPPFWNTNPAPEGDAS